MIDLIRAWIEWRIWLANDRIQGWKNHILGRDV